MSVGCKACGRGKVPRRPGALREAALALAATGATRDAIGARLAVTQERLRGWLGAAPRLTEEQRKEMRRARELGAGLGQLAATFGVTASNASRVCAGLPAPQRARRFSEEEARRLREALRSGTLSIAAGSHDLRCTSQVLRDVRDGRGAYAGL